MKIETRLIDLEIQETDSIRKQFPVLDQQINGRNLIYFDNAATSQKPICVIDAITDYYKEYNANIHRGIHTLAEKATAAYENSRTITAEFLNAKEREEIVFTSGTTYGINLVAQSYGRKFLKENDEILISTMEHHSNIVPWQILCQQTGAKLKVIPINEDGEIIFEEYRKLLTDKTRIVSIVHVSNAMGTINPVKEIISSAHQFNAVVLIDGAQSSAHLPVDVQEMDCDFFVFSAHKIFGPTGAGVLYGKRELLESMDPYQGGGEMIKEVSFERTTYNDLPFKFEAGTPNIAGIIGMGTALKFYMGLPHQALWKKEMELLKFTTDNLHEIKGVKIIGDNNHKTGIISFISNQIHHYDLGMILDTHGIAVRTGHHCAQPLMNRFQIEGTTRISLSIHNSLSELEKFFEILPKILKTIS